MSCAVMRHGSGPAHTTLQHIADTKVATDLADINSATLVDEAELRAITNSQRMRQKCRDDVLDHAVGEILLLRIAAHVLEWQHRD